MNVIIGFADLIAQSDRLDEPLRRYVSHISSAGIHACSTLRRLVEQARRDELHRASRGRGPDPAVLGTRVVPARPG